MTTGGFSSKGLLEEEAVLKIASLTNTDAFEIGEIASTLSKNNSRSFNDENV